MEILFERSFAGDLRAIGNKKLRGRISQVIEEAQNVSDFTDLKQVAKLKGSSSYYRIRVGDYRIGIELARGYSYLRAHTPSEGYISLLPMISAGKTSRHKKMETE